MKIVCPSCGADYRMSEDKIPADGLLIRCPSCQHSFRAFSNGTTASVVDGKEDETSVGQPPEAEKDEPRSVPPPPPPLDFGDDLIEFDADPFEPEAESPGLIQPPNVRDTSVDIGTGLFEQEGQEESKPVDELAPPSPVNIDGNQEPSQSEVQVDDFDFSFGASDSGTDNPPAAGPLNDLFDDLDDLPAPKTPAMGIDVSDLPKRREAIPNYEFDDIEDLPGLRNENRPNQALGTQGGQTTEGLLAPDEAVPGVATVADIPAGAAATAAASSDAVAKSTFSPPTGSGLGRKVFFALVVLVIVGGGTVGTMAYMKIGPFEKGASSTRTVKKARKGKSRTKPTKVRSTASTKTVPPPPAVDGFVPTSGATMAEVAGYRDAIAQLEPKKDALDEAGKAGLIKLYAFGALDYPENTQWAITAQKLAEGIDTKTAKKDTNLALYASRLARGDKKVTKEIEVFAKSYPRTGEAQALLGYARLAEQQTEPAYNAFRRAYKADTKLLYAQRKAGELALKLGRINEAGKILEDLYRKAPGAPAVNSAVAAIESHRGNERRAEKLLTQTLTLKSGRARPQDRSNAFVLRARIAMKSGQGNSALDDLRSAVRAWPNNSEALGLLSDSYISKSRLDDAINQLRALERAGAKSPQTAIRIAQCYGKMGRNDQALETLKSASQLYPAVAVLRSEMGNVYADRREYKKAREAYDKAIKLDPKDGSARLKVANLLVLEAKIDPALVYLGAAVKKHPLDPLMHYGLGSLRMRMAQTGASGNRALFDQAEAHYRKALALDAGLLAARQGLVTVLIENGKAKEALTELKRLSERTDFHGVTDYELARANQVLGRYEKAIEYFDKALKRDPKNVNYLKHAGITYFARKDFKKAQGLLAAVVKLEPKNVDAHYHIGLMGFLQKQYEGAVQSFQKVLERNKQHHRARYWKARSLEATGKPKKIRAARGEYDQVSAIVSKTPELRVELCDVFWRRGAMQARKFSEWNDANKELSEYLKCNPKSARGWFSRGRVRSDLGLLDAAISDFARAAKLSSKMGAAYAQNAYVRMRKPKYVEKKVQALLQRAIRADKSLARPHYVLCNMVKERNKAQARRHCQAYLKLQPKGDNAAEARLLLRSF